MRVRGKNRDASETYTQIVEGASEHTAIVGTRRTGEGSATGEGPLQQRNRNDAVSDETTKEATSRRSWKNEGKQYQNSTLVSHRTLEEDVLAKKEATEGMEQ